MPYTLGLTGTMGSGKTFVASLFSLCHAAVICADTLAREAVLPGTPALNEIVREFGPGVLSAEGALNRAALAAIVFSNPQRRQVLEGIVHPFVRQRELELLNELKPDNPLVILDVPLLFETGMNRDCDGTLVVTVDETTRALRLKAGRGMSEEDLAARLKAQWPQEKKAALATFVVDNSGTREQTAKQIAAILDVIFPAGLPAGLTKLPLEQVS